MKSPSEQGMTGVFPQQIMLIVPMIANMPKIPPLRHGQNAWRRYGEGAIAVDQRSPAIAFQ